MIIEFLPDPTSTPTNHVKSSQRPLPPIQYNHHHLFNMQKRADNSQISQQRNPAQMASGQLPDRLPLPEMRHQQTARTAQGRTATATA